MCVNFFKLCDSIRMMHSILQMAKFLPGESHGQRSLVGYSSWDCKRVGYDLATKSVPIKAENVICSKLCIPIRKDICAESGNYKC